MTYRPWCPKCSHKPLAYERGRREKVGIVSCYSCGWALYGDEKIEELVEKQRAGHKVLLKDLKRVQAQEEVNTDPNWPSCTWTECDKPTKMGRGGKPLKYCSKKCRLKNAHTRSQMRNK